MTSHVTLDSRLPAGRLMRLIHTSDWHIGHTLHDVERTAEHAAFLEWLLTRLLVEQPDLLLIAGDIFDIANPSAASVATWYRFLLSAHLAQPSLTIIAIGGNHDSGARLDAPAALLGHFRIHIVGSTPRKPTGEIDPTAMLVPVYAGDGTLLARVAAVPYLRPADLPGGDDPDRWLDAIRAIYADVFALAPDDGVPLLGMGHAYLVGGALSDSSERKIFGGNLNPLPDDIFPERISYAALGHLHRAQKIGKRASIRYSGSPFPLALDERDYPHQVCVVDIAASAPLEVRAERSPRTVQFPRFPAEGCLPLNDILTQLRTFPADQPAWIEVCVQYDPANIDPRSQIDEALERKQARCLRMATEGKGSSAGLADVADIADLSQLSKEAVFRLQWQAHAPGVELPDDMLALFHELIDSIPTDAA